MGEFLKTRDQHLGNGVSEQDRQESDFARAYPCLHEWITLLVWDDGAARVPATVTVFFEDGRFKACLSDRDQQRVAFTSGWTVDGALGALEEGLLGHTLDWRTKSGQGGGRPRK